MTDFSTDSHKRNSPIKLEIVESMKSKIESLVQENCSSELSKKTHAFLLLFAGERVESVGARGEATCSYWVHVVIHKRS